LAYTSNILLTWKLWNWRDITPLPPWLRAWWQPYSDCKLQTSEGTRDWAKFMCTPIIQIFWFKLTNSVIQFNQHNYQRLWQFTVPSQSVYCVYW